MFEELAVSLTKIVAMAREDAIFAYAKVQPIFNEHSEVKVVISNRGAELSRMQSLFQAVERRFRVDECPFHVVERRFNDGDYRKQRVILVYAP